MDISLAGSIGSVWTQRISTLGAKLRPYIQVLSWTQCIKNCAQKPEWILYTDYRFSLICKCHVAGEIHSLLSRSGVCWPNRRSLKLPPPPSPSPPPPPPLSPGTQVASMLVHSFRYLAFCFTKLRCVVQFYPCLVLRAGRTRDGDVCGHESGRGVWVCGRDEVVGMCPGIRMRKWRRRDEMGICVL